MARPRVTEAGVVLDAAARCLASHGIAATTLDDIAEEAGVSRATVYRYVGGRDDIVRAVIARESQVVLERLESVVSAATTVEAAIAEVVETALTAIAASPVLGRLSTVDLPDTLPFVTIEAADLVDAVVASLVPVIREAPVVVDPAAVDDAVEELARFVLTHLTTPRRDGSRLGPRAAGERAAALVAPMLEPKPTTA